MQFLKTLFWVVLTVILVLWAKANWFNVELKLWGGLGADVKLPVIIFTADAVGSGSPEYFMASCSSVGVPAGPNP